MPAALAISERVRAFLDARHGRVAYLVADGPGGCAAVVDPGPDLAPIEAALAAGGLRLRYVIDTRVHADHVSGARALAAAHAARDGATLCLHEAAPVAFPFRVLRADDVLALGALRLRVRHLPGDRPEQIALALHDPRGGHGPIAVLPGVAPCSTAVGRRPLDRRAIEVANRGLEDLAWAMLAAAPDVPQLTLAALEAAADAASASGVPGALAYPLLLDVREPREYARGHVPGAVNVPRSALATSLAALPRDRPIVTVCDGGARALRAAQLLRRHGFVRVSVLGAGTTAWRLSGRPLAHGV